MGTGWSLRLMCLRGYISWYHMHGTVALDRLWCLDRIRYYPPLLSLVSSILSNFFGGLDPNGGSVPRAPHALLLQRVHLEWFSF